MELQDLKYPIGKFDRNKAYTESDFQNQILSIEALPQSLRKALSGLTDAQLDTPYRPDGWTVRQVVHHLADSHINSYMRFRLALTEDKPVIKPYNEKAWADLEDAKNGPVEISLNLLDALHKRWIILLKSISAEDFKKTFIHPASGEISLEKNIGLYAWHGEHHLAHITSLKQRNNW